MNKNKKQIQNGKGDKRRSPSVSEKTIKKNWERIFTQEFVNKVVKMSKISWGEDNE